MSFLTLNLSEKLILYLYPVSPWSIAKTRRMSAWSAFSLDGVEGTASRYSIKVGDLNRQGLCIAVPHGQQPILMLHSDKDGMPAKMVEMDAAAELPHVTKIFKQEVNVASHYHDNLVAAGEKLVWAARQYHTYAKKPRYGAPDNELAAAFALNPHHFKSYFDPTALSARYTLIECVADSASVAIPPTPGTPAHRRRYLRRSKRIAEQVTDSKLEQSKNKQA